LNTATRNIQLALLLIVATSGSAFAGGSARLEQFPRGGVFVGTFSISHITDPLAGSSDTNAFDALKGSTIRFTIGFDRVEQELYSPDPDGGKKWVVTTAPAHVEFFGDPTGYLEDIIEPTLNCPLRIGIRDDADGNRTIDSFELCQAKAPEFFRFESVGSLDLTEPNDPPSIQNAGLDTQVMFLKRYDASSKMTDQATGWIRYELFENVPVAVESKTISEVKSLYGASN